MFANQKVRKIQLKCKVKRESKEEKSEIPTPLFNKENQQIWDDVTAQLFQVLQKRTWLMQSLKNETFTFIPSEHYQSMILKLSSYLSYQDAAQLLDKIKICLPALHRSVNDEFNASPFRLSWRETLKAMLIPLAVLGLARLGLIHPNTALTISVSSILYQSSNGITHYVPTFKLDPHIFNETNDILFKMTGNIISNTDFLPHVVMMLQIYQRMITDMVAAKDYKKKQRISPGHSFLVSTAKPSSSVSSRPAPC